MRRRKKAKGDLDAVGAEVTFLTHKMRKDRQDILNPGTSLIRRDPIYRSETRDPYS